MNPKAFSSRARDALSQTSGNFRALFFLHIAVIAGTTLVQTGLQWLLDLGISAFDGLSGITARSILEMVQTLLSTGISLALPFWQFGLVFLSLQLARRNFVGRPTLLAGFRNLLPVLKLNLLKALILMAVMVGTVYAATLVLTLTPLSSGLLAFANAHPELANQTDPEKLMADPAMLYQLLYAALPLLIGVAVCLLAVLIPVLYRLRMADYALCDDPLAGARNAVRTSRRLTKGNCFKLFRLDLHFWWFYALELLLSAVYLLDMYVSLPIDPTLSFWLCNLVYALGQVALYSLANPLVQTTYATAYDTLLEQEKAAQDIIII